MSFQNIARTLTVLSGLGIASAQSSSSTDIKTPDLNYTSQWTVKSGDAECHFTGPNGQDAYVYMETRPSIHQKGDWIIAQDETNGQGKVIRRRGITADMGQYVAFLVDFTRPQRLLHPRLHGQNTAEPAYFNRPATEAEIKAGKEARDRMMRTCRVEWRKPGR